MTMPQWLTDLLAMLMNFIAQLDGQLTQARAKAKAASCPCDDDPTCCTIEALKSDLLAKVHTLRAANCCIPDTNYGATAGKKP